MNSRSEVNSAGRRPNRLITEKSPYLLQHAWNPVDWHPWGTEAFDKARAENKPIFLSIGYSTCHWCHVMEHESFEDAEVARLMNDAFISIKVDREERPDLDHLYMTVCQMLTGSGGWPLTIVMTPDKKPFYAGTYFPRETRFGRIGLLELVPRIKQIWTSKRDELLTSAERITDSLRQVAVNSAGDSLVEADMTKAYEQMYRNFDARRGGFGVAPKFPNPHSLLFLLRYWKRTGSQEALAMVERTLQGMRMGGIFDHIGFGFHRYSTDERWLVPHFEKMLYDQAMLAMAYTEAFQATGKEEYGETAREIFDYILRDMTAPTGGFCSAEDADSEGEEGKFYVWTEEEVRHILQKEEADLFIRVFNLETNGNFSEEAAGKDTGANILHLTKPLNEIASHLGMPEPQLLKILEAARQKLMAVRERRVRPLRDDKVLTDWNGLMIAALARGAQVFARPDYAETAKRAADFVLDNMRTADGRLLHRHRDGQAALQANVDDHAFFIWGLLELYETIFDVSYLQMALKLNKDLIRHFWDDQDGGFYFTPDDGEGILLRQKLIEDGAFPSGNSVAMLNLLRLGRITADPDLEEKAAGIGRAFSGNVRQAPSAYAQLLTAVDFGLGPSYEVAIVGRSQAEDTRAMLQALRTRFIPGKVVILRPTEHESPEITRLAAFTKDQSAVDGKATAYVCTSYSCKAPTTSISEMLELLK